MEGKIAEKLTRLRELDRAMQARTDTQTGREPGTKKPMTNTRGAPFSPRTQIDEGPPPNENRLNAEEGGPS
jgi:hypothetical protein